MASPQPFVISVPDVDVSLLKQKLELTRFPDELSDAEWKYGVPLEDVQRLAAYWKNGYDWRHHERQLNDELPQFTVDIEVEGFDKLNIHFVHKKSERENAIPLLFVHGWPGSFIEVRKILPLLTTAEPENPSFHVVALGLPNFGFSQGVSSQGFSIPQYAEVGHKLMQLLGYKEYVTQGGDWGYIITKTIAAKYGPTHAKAWHTNMPTVSPPRFFSSPIVWFKAKITPLSQWEKDGLERTKWFDRVGRGYFQEQSTQPQTLGYSLADSPTGLLAWVYEKLVHWTDSYPWTDDEILTWISIYWFSRAGPAASVRIYFEATQYLAALSKTASTVTTVPLGVSLFPKEIHALPTSWLPTVGKLAFSSEHDSGGHFAAHEKPVELVNDLCRMFGRKGPVYGVVTGKDGY